MDKAVDAFRTISEVAEELGIQQHVLRFWETKFNQIKPLKRGGGRRYYRPDDVDLLRGIRYLLYGQGYTIKGVQRIIKEHGPKAVIAAWHELAAAAEDVAAPNMAGEPAPPTPLDATSEVSEQLFVTVRDFEGEDDAHGEGEALPPKRPEFQSRPDVSIMRGGLSGSRTRSSAITALGPKAAEPASSSSLSASPSAGEIEENPNAAPVAADPANGFSSGERAELTRILVELAEARRILDAAGRV